MLTIAWDIDDVLNALMREWFEDFWLTRHPQCRLKYENLLSNPPHALLGISLDAYRQSLDDFRLSGHYRQMAPNAEVLSWFKEQGRFFRHIALTAVPRIAASVSAAWLVRHFGDWIRTFHFVPSLRKGDIDVDYENSKVEYMKWLNRVDIFIDDHPGHVGGAASNGISTYMVSRPWNTKGMTISEILVALTAANANA